MAIPLLCLLLAPALPAQAPPSVQISVSWVSDSPVISPGAHDYATAGAFNPAAIRVGGKTILLFREQDKKGTSRIGYASSIDGQHFAIRPEPVLVPAADYEKDGGVEDPRLVKIGKTYYLTYTGYNKRDAQLCLATSTDLVHWNRQGVLLPAYQGNWNTGWTKSGAIIPAKVNGKYWMYYLGTAPDKRDYMGIASSADLLHWNDASDKPVLPRRPGAFDSRVMEPGPPPIITSAGILLIYNGADDNLVYGTAWALFDKNDPTRVIARAEEPFFRPTKEWERVGQVPNVVFTEGMVQAKNDEYWMYFGAADKYIGALRAHIKVH
jgi:predicted GH43/DUF377 family glycosyl hydrolase